MYGFRVHDMRDLWVLLSQEAIEALVTRLPGRFWVKYFPILRYVPPWVPGSSARQIGDFYKPIVSAARNEPFNKVVQDVVRSLATP